MNNPFSLEGKTIVITGASSGIGRQCAISCSQMGAQLILLGRNIEALQETTFFLQKDTQWISHSVDLLSYEKVEKIISESVHKMGKIHGLINCAGISTTLPLRMVKPEKLDHFFQTNVTTAIELSRIITKKSNISASGGSIIFMSSVMGSVGEAGKIIYSTTKGALLAASKSLAVELARRKIRVNCVSPGVVETPMSKAAVYSQNETAQERIKELHPLGLGTVEDVANACIYLLSDESRWVTGTNLFVDGGYTAR